TPASQGHPEGDETPGPRGRHQRAEDPGSLDRYLSGREIAVKSSVFTPGKVRSLSSYLGYLFLRFPGTLGPEESWDLECLDTYDRRWSRLGQMWVRRDGAPFLVEPPTFFPREDDASVFGLQKPQVLGRITVKIRPVEFASPGGAPIR